MNQLLQTGKRIVSKGRYVAAYSVKIGCYFAALMFLIKFSFFGADVFSHMNLSPGGEIAFLFLFAVGSLFVLGFTLEHTWRLTRKIDPGIPLTRANTADLPAPDSLVRASEEPMQEQQAVLLRATTEIRETPPEQLVRPAGGTEA